MKANDHKNFQAVRNFILAHPRKFASYITFHSFGSKIMYPWSYANLKVKIDSSIF